MNFFFLNLAGYHVTQLRTDFEELCIRLTVESNHKISIVYSKIVERKNSDQVCRVAC